jgi:hypothetical protein
MFKLEMMAELVLGKRIRQPKQWLLRCHPLRFVLMVYVVILIEEPGNSYNNQYSFVEGCQVGRVEAISFWD